MKKETEGKVHTDIGPAPNQTKKSGAIAGKMRKHMEAFVHLAMQRAEIERGQTKRGDQMMAAMFWASIYIPEFIYPETFTKGAPAVLVMGQLEPRKISLLCNWGARPLDMFKAWIRPALRILFKLEMNTRKRMTGEWILFRWAKIKLRCFRIEGWLYARSPWRLRFVDRWMIKVTGELSAEVEKRLSKGVRDDIRTRRTANL